jgi:acyl-CoA dehydrogenase
MKQTVAELGIEVLGAPSMRWHAGPRPADDESASPALLRDYLNSRAFTIFGGASEVQLDIIAKTLVRL